MRINWFISVIATIMIVAACGQTEEEQGGADLVDELTPIEVELDVPESAEIGETITFSSSVTQGEDFVDDAREVVYEIWPEGQKEQSELIEAEEQEGHVYLLDHVFKEAGNYHVQTHVTARGLHRMPTSQIQVGEVESHEQDEEDHSHEDGHHHEHEHRTEIDINTSIEGVERLVVQVAVEGLAYTGGDVTLEMWQDGDEQRQWLDLDEIEEGEFELRNIDEFSGTYYVIVHIQDEKLHEHFHIELEF
ncbi:FixH family protein [Halalkalibacter lacteus]|uniref:FixH family protein n=1 Tax=Halalkalibacter lacteus TaxID=3090663 RepID=UPI002FCC2B53